MLLSSESDVEGDTFLGRVVFHLLSRDTGWSLVAPFILILAR